MEFTTYRFFLLWLVLFLSCMRNVRLPQGCRESFFRCVFEPSFARPLPFGPVARREWLYCLRVAWGGTRVSFPPRGVRLTSCHLSRALSVTCALRCHLCLKSGVYFWTFSSARWPVYLSLYRYHTVAVTAVLSKWSRVEEVLPLRSSKADRPFSALCTS